MTQPKQTRGHKKRARTRARIIAAGVEAYVVHGDGLTVDSVVARADVSHGTFYNYFDDLSALIDAVVFTVGERITRAVATEGAEDPALRLAVATLRILQVLDEQPSRARVVLRLMANPEYDISPITEHLRFDIVAGRESQRFIELADELSFDLVVGGMLMGVRRIARGEWDLDLGVGLVKRLLIDFGLDRDEADSIAAEAIRQLDTPTSIERP